jgi:hypothetical protein
MHTPLPWPYQQDDCQVYGGELDRAGALGFFRDRLRGKEGTMPGKIVARKYGL